MIAARPGLVEGASMPHLTPLRRPLFRLAFPMTLLAAFGTAAFPAHAKTAHAEPVHTEPAHAEPAGSVPRVLEGSIDGAPYRVEIPDRWNGTLLLWSHGAYSLELAPPTEIALTNHPATRRWLLDHGFALAASQYRVVQGWGAVESGLKDQKRLLDWFTANVGPPRRTVSAGASAGGLIAVLLAERHPSRFAGVAALCGAVGGTTGHFNSALDMSHAVKTLLAPELELVRVQDPEGNTAKAREVLSAALDDPRGRARLALASALADVPGRYGSRAPTPDTVTDQVRNQFFFGFYERGAFWGVERAAMEARAGGNPSWNTGVDYRTLFTRSSQQELVKRAYREAGLDLASDLKRLNAAPRVKADPGAVAHLDRYGTPHGRTPWPVVTLHSTGDGTVPSGNERRYAELVRHAGHPAKLRQLYVDRGNHCTFTASEEIVALRTLFHRLDAGRWNSTHPIALNTAASAFGSDYQTVFDVEPAPGLHATTPAFTHHHPGRYLRP
jgi:alpha-beta hydrolase superfamily lysophospholipase